ncbi:MULTISPECIES: AMP-binding protein [Streptomyces]|uniref:AMP-binding protein n=1 Tax=Streptomyces TaxID=1883 RepID=UPI000D505E7F|nr:MULTISPECIES: AMP-binding protein [Streptomyces]PVC64136.1 fatty acid--CoA ligase [Streptomyces sp. CS065A]
MREPTGTGAVEDRLCARPAARYVTELFTGLHRWSGRIALRTGKRQITFDELLAQSYRIARALERMGHSRHEGIVCLTANPPELVALRLAAHLLGSRFTALNVNVPGDVTGWRGILASVRPAVFLVDRRGAEVLGEPVPGTLTLGVPEAGCDLLARAAEESGEPLAPRAREEDIALLVPSHGTTGPRRGAVHRFSGMRVDWRRPEEGALGDFPAGITTLAVSPLAGNAGEVVLMLLRQGCTALLMDDFDPGRVLATVEAERITSVYLLSGHLRRLLAHPDVGRTDLSSLRYVPYGNAPVPAATVRRAVEVFGPVLAQNYLSSEIRAITLLRQEDHLAAAARRPELLRSVGRALPEVEIRIRGPRDEPLPCGACGEVWLRAPHMMSGYWRDPAGTARVMRGGWLHSGDRGRLDEEGYLYLTGRA